MSENKEIQQKETSEPTVRPVTADTVKLSPNELEDVSGGFLDAHGDVCIGLGAMATITTGGTKN